MGHETLRAARCVHLALRCLPQRTAVVVPDLRRLQALIREPFGVIQILLILAHKSLSKRVVGVDPGQVQRSRTMKVMNIYRIVEALRIPSLPAIGLLAMGALAIPAQAQKQSDEDQGSLQQARKTFATADADMNGSLSRREASVAGIPSREFSVRDTDMSQAWTIEEFLLYYHDLLVNSAKEPGADLVTEVKRIVGVRAEAAKRAREAKEAADLRRRARERLRDRSATGAASGDAPAVGSTNSGNASQESISEKLRRAREALKARSLRAKSSREAYEQTAGGLAERARGAAGEAQLSEDATDEDWAAKLRRARAALERRAKDGSWSREQLDAADRRLIERARAAEQGVDLTTLPASVRSKYERALVALSDRAQAGNWSREKYEIELQEVLLRAKGELGAHGQGVPPTTQKTAGATVKTGSEKVAQDDSQTSSRPGLSDARRDYERGLVALDERAKAGGWSRERYESERAELAQRVGLKSGGDQSASGEDDIAPDPKLEARKKLGRAEEALESRARRAGMKREQHEKLTEDLFERARSQMAINLLCLSTSPGPPSHAVRTKYERAIEALITRAKKADMTRTAFEFERDQLLKRANEEASAFFDGQEESSGDVKQGTKSKRRIETAKPVEPKKSTVEKVVPAGSRGGL